MSYLRYISGKDKFVGWGISWPVPIQLDPGIYKGVLLWGSDDFFHWSDGKNWVRLLEELIDPPNGIAPLTEPERLQLRLTPYNSKSGLLHTRTRFEVFKTNNPTNDPPGNVLIIADTQNNPEYDFSLCQREPGQRVEFFCYGYNIQESDGLAYGEGFYWRGQYFSDDVQSRFSQMLYQVYPKEFRDPEYITPVNAVTSTLETTTPATAFTGVFLFISLEYEIWDSADPEDPAANLVDTAFIPAQDMEKGAFKISNVGLQKLEDGVTYYWRARHWYIEVAAPNVDKVTEWTPGTRGFQSTPESIVLQYNNTLSGVSSTARFYIDIQGVVEAGRIRWGDGSEEPLVVGGPFLLSKGELWRNVYEHTYTEQDTWTVRIIPDRLTMKGFGSYGFATGLGITSQGGITAVDAIGDNLGITDLNSAFLNATNLIRVPNRAFANFDEDGNRINGLTSLSRTFQNCTAFNSPLDKWDVKNVTSMFYTFSNCKNFDRDISSWEVDSLRSLWGTFSGCASYNRPMNAWGEHLAGTGAALSDMRACFQLCEVFNQDLDEWAEGVKNVTQAGSMFDRAYVFNGDITTWKLAQNTNLSYMFRQAYQFNRDLSNWDVSKVTSFIWCFDNCRAFSQSLANWDFSSATDTTYMFRNCTLMGTRLTDEAGTWTFGSRWEAAARMFDNIPNFNPDLSNWENQVAGLKRMDGMFVNCSQFEGIGLELWKVSSVINMNQMFYNCGLFNKDISNWDVSNVGIPETGAGGFYQTFWKCTNFNQTLANWNVNQCADFRYMFRDCSSLTDLECETWFEYNDDPDLWPSKATTLLEMFRGCSSFDKDLSKWDTRNIYDLRNMFRDCTVFNNGGMPMPWTIQTVSTQLPPRDPPPGWKGSILLDGMFNNTAFFNADISTWNVSGVTGAIAVFERAKGFDQDLSNWRLDSCRNATYFLNGVNKNFNSALDRLFPTTAPDDTREPVLERLYAFCANTNWNNGQANTELPGKELLWDVSKCWDFRYFCWNNQEFNQNIGNWDVSSATQMTHMFGVTGKLATDSSPSEFGFNCGDAPADPKFNPIQNWDVTSVQDIRQIFDRAYAFNKNLNSWNLRDCATFSQAFKDADVWTNGGSDDGSRTIPLDWSGEQMRNATNTVNMFRSLARYDEAVYLNMSLVSEAGGMFYQSSSFAKYFDKFLPDWNISSLQNALEFVNFAIPQATMDNILISWAEKGRRNPPEARTNVEIFFGNSSFTGGGAAEDAFNFLTGAIEDGGLNWTITGLVRRAP